MCNVGTVRWRDTRRDGININTEAAAWRDHDTTRLITGCGQRWSDFNRLPETGWNV
jgi:hypothetical protein